MDIFSSSWLRKVWKEYDVRFTVMLSLVLQVVLIFLGNRRKYDYKVWIKFFVWCAYLAADSVATVALGVLSNNLGDLSSGAAEVSDATIQLTAFWAPFLLLHLGGPDAVTAYSLEDNELWLRHLLQG
ncbi:uncharacterized protein LOC116105121 [Pistacia vera]|uniref:uncharacterized protein LOC116105121 n=1 Tax=Pistacia vera TaxID=55513 RepID=UPI0012633C06|nr:uncharacterized protein LOC116105121 [Pistacia vera]